MGSSGSYATNTGLDNTVQIIQFFIIVLMMFSSQVKQKLLNKTMTKLLNRLIETIKQGIAKQKCTAPARNNYYLFFCFNFTF